MIGRIQTVYLVLGIILLICDIYKYRKEKSNVLNAYTSFIAFFGIIAISLFKIRNLQINAVILMIILNLPLIGMKLKVILKRESSAVEINSQISLVFYLIIIIISTIFFILGAVAIGKDISLIDSMNKFN